MNYQSTQSLRGAWPKMQRQRWSTSHLLIRKSRSVRRGQSDRSIRCCSSTKAADNGHLAGGRPRGASTISHWLRSWLWKAAGAIPTVELVAGSTLGPYRRKRHEEARPPPPTPGCSVFMRGSHEPQGERLTGGGSDDQPGRWRRCDGSGAVNTKRDAKKAFLLMVCLLPLLSACSHPWIDSHGHRVPRQVLVETRAECKGGPDWEILVFGGQRFIQDPDGRIPAEALSSPYQARAHLPSDASWTGYRQGSRRLGRARPTHRRSMSWRRAASNDGHYRQETSGASEAPVARVGQRTGFLRLGFLPPWIASNRMMPPIGSSSHCTRTRRTGCVRTRPAEEVL